MKNKMKIYGIIFLIAVILIAPLLKFNTYILGHDSLFHISNIEAIKQAFLSGNWFFPQIYPIIANGYGYGTGLFYGPIPHLGTALISFIFPSVSTMTVMKLIHFLVIFLSMLFMYNFIYKLTKKQYLSLIPAILYVTFPYFLTDIFVRDAYAESLTFVYIPLIFNGLYELLYLNNDKKFYILFIPAVVALVLTHTITTFYTAIFIMLFLLLNIRKVFKKKNFKALCISLIFIIGICAFYYVPMPEQKAFSNINIFNDGVTATKESVMSNALNISALFPYPGNQTENGLQFFILIPMIILIFISFCKYKEYKNDNKKIFLDFIIIGLISLFMSTKFFPWGKVPDIMLYIQFPWRLLLFSAFFLSAFSVLGLLDFNPKFEKVLSVILIILVVSNSLSLINIKKVAEYDISAVDINSMGIGAVKDYLPMKAVENYEYFENRSKDIIILEGKGKIEILDYEAPYMKFNAELESDYMVIELPLLYYFGYNVDSHRTYYDTNASSDALDKLGYKIEESKNGFVQLTITNSRQYIVNYTGSKYSEYAKYISLISIIIYVIYIQKKRGDENAKKRNSIKHFI